MFDIAYCVKHLYVTFENHTCPELPNPYLQSFMAYYIKFLLQLNYALTVKHPSSVLYIRIERTSLYFTGLKTIFYNILETISQSAQEMWQFVRSFQERRVNVKVEGKWINSETKTKYLIKLNKNNTQPSTEIQISFVLILTIKIKQVNNLNFDQRSKFELVRPYNHSMCRS